MRGLTVAGATYVTKILANSLIQINQVIINIKHCVLKNRIPFLETMVLPTNNLHENTVKHICFIGAQFSQDMHALYIDLL